ncbi:Lipoprotein-releasing system ATP-binding protein LolD [Nonomuraea coxensis DSM 45129]|uniref:Lipoprotein-releasing system ATP-binding protein LolD n=1 Tax=Nonomuraea coxensis DSM 45129 TaxID=1122611 RepID=A0ABX8U9N7_9ACTN|nr:ABC transporter ATP-binding protein [Nonomuraea coxensis]QYC44255.1 Lipoprotein-releasing system ATP-binding protein LolD [Nonomuraea coxensis DSM 45129]
MSITPLPLPQPPAKAPEFGRDALIVCESLVRIYQSGSVEVQALQGLDLVVDSGEMVAVVGASGSGKSTLLSILAGVDAPTAGRVRVDRWNLLDMSRADRVRYRRHTVGLVRQQTAANLIPYLTARQMVDLPMTAARTPRRVRRRRAAELLDLLGVAECAERRPAQLSGGQQMRVAIAVALANEPRVLLADEPTGELDNATSAAVFGLLREINRRLGVTVVIVTHDPSVSGQVERTVAIRDGRTSSEVLRRTATGDDGAPQVIAEEYAVMDRTGRIQVPRDYREALALTRRVRLVLEADHVAIRPDGGGPG